MCPKVLIMNNNKAILYGKEKRKPYRKSKNYDSSCRNHGSCNHCLSDRTYKNKKQELKVIEQLCDLTIDIDE